jgi:hypothetical protein
MAFGQDRVAVGHLTTGIAETGGVCWQAVDGLA